MDSFIIHKLALILAIQAEIEGMKAENEQRKTNNEAMAFTEEDFSYKANELRVLASFLNPKKSKFQERLEILEKLRKER